MPRSARHSGTRQSLKCSSRTRGPSRSSSRTSSASRAMSGMRSSCRSATASTRTAGCGTSGGRCCATAASAGGTSPATSGASELNPFEADVRDRLAACGITVVPQYGVGGYRIDFAATHPGDTDRMLLAIEADGASYRKSGSVRDRDRLRGEHLQRLGWTFHRVWSTNWFRDPQSEVAKLQKAYDEALSAADVASPEPEPPAAEPPAAGSPAAG